MKHANETNQGPKPRSGWVEDHPGFWEKVGRKLLLRPHGSQNLLPQAKAWLGVMAFLAFSMAVIEGFAWMAVIQDAVPSDIAGVRVAVGVLIGLMVGVMIWSVDTSFITSDFTVPPYVKENKNDIVAHNKFSQWIDKYKPPHELAPALAFAFRFTFLVAFSYWTAPFLAQVLISDDIESALATERGQQREAVADSVRGATQERRTFLTGELDDLRSRLTGEVEGTVGSGIPGDGPTAATIRENIAAKARELRSLNEEVQSELREIETMEYEAFVSTYGVADKSGSFAENAIQVRLMADDNAYKKAKVLAILLLYGLFACIAVLKFLQPHAVRLYLNGYLQSMWENYMRGQFNDDIKLEYLFPDQESHMKDYVFEKWLISFERDEYYENARRRRMKQIEDAEAQAMAEAAADAKEAREREKAEQAAAEARRKKEAAAQREKEEAREREKVNFEMETEKKERARSESERVKNRAEEGLAEKVSAIISQSNIFKDERKKALEQERNRYDTLLSDLVGAKKDDEVRRRRILMLQSEIKELDREVDAIRSFRNNEGVSGDSLEAIRDRSVLRERIRTIEQAVSDKRVEMLNLESEVASAQVAINVLEGDLSSSKRAKEAIEKDIGDMEESSRKAIRDLMTGMSVRASDFLAELGLSDKEINELL